VIKQPLEGSSEFQTYRICEQNEDSVICPYKENPEVFGTDCVTVQLYP